MASLFLLSAFAISVAVPVPARADGQTSVAPVFVDNFTTDTSLNTALWQINGTVAQNFTQHNAIAPINITLAPTFSSAGMEIAQATGSGELGAMQSVPSFTPPFTVIALAEGIESNGHPIIFGIANHNATYGYQVTGNLNPNDCSAEKNCGDPSTCGIPANSSIGAGQCYYGMYGRYDAGKVNGTWGKTAMLNYSPSIDVIYTIEIALDANGSGQVTVLNGTQVLGQQTGKLGSEGPYYLIVAQGEGSPVPGPGDNIAEWKSITVTPTSAYAGSPSSGSASSSDSWIIIVLVLVIVAILALVVLGRRRRRGFTVRVLDSGTLSAVPGAGVWATGPENLSGSTGSDGRIAFGSVKDGDYAVRASATGYNPSIPVTVAVQKTADHTVRLDRLAPSTPAGGAPSLAFGTAGPTAEPPQVVAVPTVPPVSTAAVPPPAPAPAVPEEGEGWAGVRIRQIIQTFQAKGAISPETALTADELGLSRMFVRVMKRRRGKTRIFIEVNGKYYLDEKTLNEAREMRELLK